MENIPSQRTIKKEIKINGIGLHTGEPSNIILWPASENSGIVFRRVDLGGEPTVAAAPENIFMSDKALQRTSVKKGKAEVHTIEHLLAALSGFSIDNILVDIDNMELPGLDGSSKNISEALEETGFEEQNTPKKIVEIRESVSCRDGSASIEALPASEFKIEYHLEFSKPWLKEQAFIVTIDSSENFRKFFKNELAPCRTFCFEEEALVLLKTGLGKGAGFHNTLVISKDGPINNEFRFPDELVRHKVLDLMGDLYLLGGHLKGHIIARKSGHRLNTALIKGIYERHAAFMQSQSRSPKTAGLTREKTDYGDF